VLLAHFLPDGNIFCLVLHSYQPPFLVDQYIVPISVKGQGLIFVSLIKTMFRIQKVSTHNLSQCYDHVTLINQEKTVIRHGNIAATKKKRISL
jgi:hypothetical protein